MKKENEPPSAGGVGLRGSVIPNKVIGTFLGFFSSSMTTTIGTSIGILEERGGATSDGTTMVEMRARGMMEGGA